MKKYEKGHAVSWLSLVISLIAIALSLFVYFEQKDEATTAIDEVKQSVSDLDQRVALANARNDLLRLEDQIKTESVSEETKREISDIRTELNKNFTNVSGESKQKWEEVDRGLQKLQLSLAQNSQEAPAAYDDLLDSFNKTLSISLGNNSNTISDLENGPGSPDTLF